MDKVKYVKKLSAVGYPTADKRYAEAHEKASAAEKKANPKMYKAERKAEYKLKPKELMATHKKDGEIEIEKKFKKFTPDLKIHEKTEWKADPGKKKRK